MDQERNIVVRQIRHPLAVASYLLIRHKDRPVIQSCKTLPGASSKPRRKPLTRGGTGEAGVEAKPRGKP